jgi:hypothetical protein
MKPTLVISITNMYEYYLPDVRFPVCSAYPACRQWQAAGRRQAGIIPLKSE